MGRPDCQYHDLIFHSHVILIPSRIQTTDLPQEKPALYQLGHCVQWDVCTCVCDYVHMYMCICVYMYIFGLYQTDSRMGIASVSHFGRSGDSDHVGSNPGRVKPMTLKLTLLLASQAEVNKGAIGQ